MGPQSVFISNFRWAELLSEFNYRIMYRPWKQDIKPDSLTRCQYDLSQEDSDDRRQDQSQVLLKNKHLDKGVKQALSQL